MAEGAYLRVLPRDVSQTKLKRCSGIRQIELQRCEECFGAVNLSRSQPTRTAHRKPASTQERGK
jgi:hypothetical protein